MNTKPQLQVFFGDDGFTFNKEQSKKNAEIFSNAFQASLPYKHIVIDNFLPQDILEEVLLNFPKRELPNDINFEGGVFEESKRQILPYDCNRYIKEFFALLNSSHMLLYLESLTGIEGLIADPYYEGGGFHEISAGGKLGIHSDFRLHKKLHLERRVNLLIYLNKDWDESYGGALELWDNKMSNKEKTIFPLFNRCVIFEAGSDTFHGHPEPLKSPKGVTRKSIAMYYYTASKAIYEEVDSVSTVFKARPDDSEEIKEQARRQNMDKDWQGIRR
jgi:Rps23 Pro-64 3,4-dihydroxylase Tpa1-like proline 4-hydroxylase